MEELKYKTSLKCNGCIAAIKPGIEQIEGVESWAVDLQSAEKVLTITASKPVSDNVINAVKKTGYLIERIS